MANENSATTDVAQDVVDITSRVAAALGNEGSVTDDDNEVFDDAEELPEEDDSDSEDDDGSDLEDIASEEELSLAGYLGIPDDRIIVGEDGSVLFNAIIDGESKQVPLKELAASFQLQGHVNNKSIALENERKELTEVKNKVAMDLSQRLQGVEKLGELAEAELVAEYKSINWEALRYQDPANWTALRQEYAERAQKIQQVQALAVEERTRIVAEQQEQLAEMNSKYFAEQNQKILADNPTWADEAVRVAAVSEIRSFLQQYGFSEDDAKNVSDHRLIRLIKDAQAFKAGTKAATEKREGKALPKFVKPGSARTNSQQLSKAREQKALRSTAKKTGNVNDIAKAILNRM